MRLVLRRRLSRPFISSSYDCGHQSVLDISIAMADTPHVPTRKSAPKTGALRAVYDAQRIAGRDGRLSGRIRRNLVADGKRGEVRRAGLAIAGDRVVAYDPLGPRVR